MNIPLLSHLRSAGDRFVPLGELGDDLDRVRSDLAEFEAFGFGIERHPYLGAAYRGPAERLCPDQIEHELDARHVGRRIAVWNRVSSTNDLATRASASSANDGLVVLAEEQTSGRGRHGRTWSAPPRSSLLMSVLLFPSDLLISNGWLTALGAVATAEVVAAWTSLETRIKWPNDVRVGGRKIAGVLVERGAGAVIGIGLNANLTLDDLTPDLQKTATSLRILTGQPVDRSELARRLIARLDHWYALGHSTGAQSLGRRWRDLSEHLGQVVRVNTPAGEAIGHLVDIDLTRGITLSPRGRAPAQIAAVDILSLAPLDHSPGVHKLETPPGNW
ncbi:MAG: biotin--[acetyl-CoA-carboxylase] ligase [Isosphaeraceae bacterium]|nr:biotin--[acetyl-CoA-carboxylase] ligase [Isosphaeraceae bacterium]